EKRCLGRSQQGPAVESYAIPLPRSAEDGDLLVEAAGSDAQGRTPFSASTASCAPRPTSWSRPPPAGVVFAEPPSGASPPPIPTRPPSCPSAVSGAVNTVLGAPLAMAAASGPTRGLESGPLIVMGTAKEARLGEVAYGTRWRSTCSVARLIVPLPM